MKDVISIDFIKTPTADIKNLAELKRYWAKIKNLLVQREQHFDNVWKNSNEKQIFAELAFCLFTPQSKAVSCWAVVLELARQKMLFSSSAETISATIKNVRFHRNKAAYLIKARELFSDSGKIKIKSRLSAFSDIYELRAWLIKNVKGIGYKEAGHFLRNIGLGKDLAILDRHILKNLVFFGAIDQIPKNLSPKEYEKIEKKMLGFAAAAKIPMSHMDMILWCKESGGIFK
ncbi:MAG: N-glycosylase/DNA lyase [Elusimicrobiota bacterium]|jgi:N-glycosylase/DNA lyase|nr:N-glycosylase/DNA lyase [Elusimicrobiota bacterium]